MRPSAVIDTESDARIRDFCGLCLGEVGAVDPSRVGLRLRDGATAEASGASGGGAGQVGHPESSERVVCLCLLILLLAFTHGTVATDSKVPKVISSSPFHVECFLRDVFVPVLFIFRRRAMN